MRLVIQRVLRASVSVEGGIVSEIGKGLMILVGVENGDTAEDAAWLASKATRLRIFDDADGVMNLGVIDVGIFGADIQVELVNDGPVTIIIDSRLRE